MSAAHVQFLGGVSSNASAHTTTVLRPSSKTFNAGTAVKTINGLVVASVKTLRSGLAITSGKTFNGLA